MFRPLRLKIFSIILVLLISIARAQERNCSTTWTEAVSVISENKACIEEVYLGGFNIEPPPIAEIKIDSSNIYISYDHTFENLKYDYVWKMRNAGAFTIPLIRLQQVYRENENVFLKLVDEFAIHNNKQYLWSPSGEGYLYDPNSGTKKTDFIVFSVSDSAGTSKLLLAFKELACIAGTKRRDK